MSLSQHANRSGGLTAVDDFISAMEGAAPDAVSYDRGRILTDKPDETVGLADVCQAR